MNFGISVVKISLESVIVELILPRNKTCEMNDNGENEDSLAESLRELIMGKFEGKKTNGPKAFMTRFYEQLMWLAY